MLTPTPTLQYSQAHSPAFIATLICIHTHIHTHIYTHSTFKPTFILTYSYPYTPPTWDQSDPIGPPCTPVGGRADLKFRRKSADVGRIFKLHTDKGFRWEVISSSHPYYHKNEFIWRHGHGAGKRKSPFEELAFWVLSNSKAQTFLRGLSWADAKARAQGQGHGVSQRNILRRESSR